MSRVTVVGGGFSGLVTAYYLAENGHSVRLLEKSERLGGLIGTRETPHGPIELAASSLRNSARLEALCEDLDVELIEAKKESRARYLYRGRPRRWPLRPGESLGMAGRLSWHLLRRRHRPGAGETIDQWATRVVGSSAAHYIVGAALQGIYAGDPEEMSATLIAGKREKPKRGSRKGLVAPTRGMSQLIDALEKRIRSLGVEIQTGVEVDGPMEGPVIIATSANGAARLLDHLAPSAPNPLHRIEMLPLIRVSAFYPAEENTIGGFGILFPRDQGVRALGVLFNTNIFENRGEGHAENWIYGGASDRGIVELDDDQIIELVAGDRRVVYGRDADPLAIYVQRWPSALPHYDLRLERILSDGIELPPNVHLVGNYLGAIGLTSLLEVASSVAQNDFDD